MIRGITFSEQAFYSADFAHYQNFFLNRQSGITKGCGVSHDGEKVTIDTGYFIAHGRLLNVEEPEIITETAGFVSGYNRIVYEIDLSKENSITKFQQGSIRVLATEDLIQEDLDNGGLVYQMPFCHFQWSGVTISEFIIDAPTLVLDNIFADISANFEAVNAQFEAWLAEQQNAATTWTESQKTAAKTAMDADVSAVDKHAETAQTTIDEIVDNLADTTIGAGGIGYSNTTSGLDAQTVQEAIDELNSEKAASSHNHAAGEITSGTLGVARGGTGKATHTANAVLTGNTTGAVNNVATASGALYATAANGAAKFGTLPVAQGGTGAETADAAMVNLGVNAHIVETGTDNGWAYWKYSNGLYLGRQTVALDVPAYSAAGNVYAATTTSTNVIAPSFASTAPIVNGAVIQNNPVWLGRVWFDADYVLCARAYTPLATSATTITIRMLIYGGWS